MADYASLDYDHLAQAYMRLLEERGSGFRGIPHEGATYQSKDPGGQRWREGEVSSDVGLLDPVDLLAGYLSAGASRVQPTARQLRTWYHGYDPVRAKAFEAQLERDSWIALLKSIERDKTTAVRPMFKLPAKYPPPEPIFPMDTSAQELSLAERLRDLTRWRTGEDEVMHAAESAIPEFDLSMDQAVKDMIASGMGPAGGRTAPHNYWVQAPVLPPPPDVPGRRVLPVPTDPLPWPPPTRRPGSLPVPELPARPSGTPLAQIPLEELLPRQPGQGDDQLLLAGFLEDYSRVLRGEPSTTLPRTPGAEPTDRLEALEILRSYIDNILTNLDIPGGGMHRPKSSGGAP